MELLLIVIAALLIFIAVGQSFKVYEIRNIYKLMDSMFDMFDKEMEAPIIRKDHILFAARAHWTNKEGQTTGYLTYEILYNDEDRSVVLVTTGKNALYHHFYHKVAWVQYEKWKLYVREHTHEEVLKTVSEQLKTLEHKDGEELIKKLPVPSQLEILKYQLEVALDYEDYEKATLLRNEISKIENGNEEE